MRTWPCCYTTGNSASDSWPCVFCPLPQWRTPEWWLHSQQKKKGCAFLLTFPAPRHQQWTRFVLWLRCQNRRNVRTIVELPRPKFSAARRSTLILAHLHSDASSGLDKYSSRTLVLVTKKKSPSVNSNQFSIVAKLSRSAVYLKMYLATSSSSPPPTLWTFSTVFTEAQPQVFSTFSRCSPRLSSEKLFWKRPSTPARQPLSTSLHFQTSAFATALVPVLSVLVAESTVGTLVWRPRCEGETVVNVWSDRQRHCGSSTTVSCVLLSSTFCCQLKPFLILGWWLCNLSDPIVCVCGQRDMDPLIHSTSYSVKRVNESGLMFGCQPCRCDC